MERVTMSTEQHCVDTIPAVRTDDVSTITDSDHNVTDDSSLAALSSACTDAFQLHRKTKQILSLEQQLLQTAQEELDETLKTIEADRQKISVLQHEQIFTVRQIKDAMSQDVKRFEATLSSKQPDLLSYCNELTSTRDCLQAIRSIRDCKHHIHLAEMIVANRYAALLAERATDSETGGKTTSTAVVTFGSIPLTAPPSYINDASAGTAGSSQLTARKLRHLSLQCGSTSPSSSGAGKTSTNVSSSSTTSRTQDLARSSSNTVSNDLPGIVRIEIRDRDAPRPGTRDQLLKPLAQTQSTSCGAASKAQKRAKT